MLLFFGGGVGSKDLGLGGGYNILNDTVISYLFKSVTLNTIEFQAEGLKLFAACGFRSLDSGSGVRDILITSRAQHLNFVGLLAVT